MTVPGFEEITKAKPEKTLVAPLRKQGGAMPRAELLSVIGAAGPSEHIGLSISNATSSACRPRL